MGHTEVVRGRNYSDAHAAYCTCSRCQYPQVGKSDARFLIYGAVLALLVVGVLIYG